MIFRDPKCSSATSLDISDKTHQHPHRLASLPRKAASSASPPSPRTPGCQTALLLLEGLAQGLGSPLSRPPKQPFSWRCAGEDRHVERRLLSSEGARSGMYLVLAARETEAARQPKAACWLDQQPHVLCPNPRTSCVCTFSMTRFTLDRYSREVTFPISPCGSPALLHMQYPSFPLPQTCLLVLSFISAPQSLCDDRQ